MGDIFKVSWGEPWYQLKVIEITPYNMLTWECVDANQIIKNLEGVEKEWVGTKLLWKFEQVDAETIRVNFEHQGLVPEFICYDVCSGGWDYYITLKLKQYLEGINSGL